MLALYGICVWLCVCYSCACTLWDLFVGIDLQWTLAVRQNPSSHPCSHSRPDFAFPFLLHLIILFILLLFFLCCSCFCWWWWCYRSNHLSHLKTRLYFHYLSLLSSWVAVRILPNLLCLLSLSTDSQLWWLLSFMDWGDICISASHKIGILLLCLWPPFSVSSQYCALIFYLPQFCPPTFAYCNSSLTFHPTSWCPSNIYFLRFFVHVETWAWPTKCYLKKGRCLWCAFFLLSVLLRSEFEVH